jgi:hypothetical protein
MAVIVILLMQQQLKVAVAVLERHQHLVTHQAELMWVTVVATAAMAEIVTVLV